MSNTPIYGLPFEHPVDDEPGHTLDGGALGTEPILAEEVETELARIDTDLSSALARLALLEAGTSMVGWVPIQSGTNTGFSFDVDLTDGGRFPVGEFALIRVHMRFDLSAEGFVNVNINADTGGNVYRTATVAHDSDPTGVVNDVIQHSAARGSWTIGHGATVSTNNLVATLFSMDGNFFHSYQATSNRQSDNPEVHAWAEHWGALTASLSAAPSFLRFFAFDLSISAITFANAFWWVEGYRVPA